MARVRNGATARHRSSASSNLRPLRRLTAAPHTAFQQPLNRCTQREGVPYGDGVRVVVEIRKHSTSVMRLLHEASGPAIELTRRVTPTICTRRPVKADVDERPYERLDDFRATFVVEAQRDMSRFKHLEYLGDIPRPVPELHHMQQPLAPGGSWKRTKKRIQAIGIHR